MLETLVNFLIQQEDEKNFSADTLVLAGNSLPNLISYTAKFVKEKKIKTVMFCGGIGHGTQFLIDNYKEMMPELHMENFSQLPEATIMLEIFKQTYGDISQLDIIKEEQSTNTGENARFSLAAFDNPPEKIWLVQDPLLKKRSLLTFQKNWPIPTKDIALMPYPTFDENWWPKEYYLSLVIGEIRRLHDDEQGYGPKGANYIPHVDIPDNVWQAYLAVKDLLIRDVRKN
ncbi:YdcF family protein [Enterococcus sp. ALS3]|uniref:YdcF family protein n=1 Tax=Enterococcus alishanensis TaxID=1303817 RepID=A0ABS6TD99_9ENTE|nr:YdcF family protein [Enterococcus alishanensis]MBV7390876.1 YdcF family protein [Enterococcus alishanensis]